MELRLQKFISSMGTLSDVRNLDPFNPIVMLMEHPVNAIQYTIIVSIIEPSYMAIPINCIWVCMDSTKPSFKKALKLKAVDRTTYEGEEELVDGFKQAWITLSKYDDVFSDPQYYDNGGGGGGTGPMGPQGPKGDKGDKGDTPTLDYTAIAAEVAKILGNGAPALSSIALTGLGTTIFEGKTAQLAVKANYSNGSNADVLSKATFVVAPSSAGTVNASGLFSAVANVDADTPFTITASYTEGGVTKTAVVNCTLKNVVATGLTINGSATVNEKTTSQYTATLTRNDGSTATVKPSYSLSTANGGAIDANGLFAAVDVAADVNVTINASFTENGVTVTGTKAITVKNVATQITPYFGVASTTATKDANLILSLTGRGPSAARQMNPCSMTSGAGQSYYYAYPVAYGLATFVDLGNGFEGGMDGAHGDKGVTLGPITVNVTIDGQSIPFYLYASDQSNLGLTNWNVL